MSLWLNEAECQEDVSRIACLASLILNFSSRCEGLISRQFYFILEERAQGISRIWGWVGCRNDVDAVWPVKHFLIGSEDNMSPPHSEFENQI
jgi:hypothetical protein